MHKRTQSQSYAGSSGQNTHKKCVQDSMQLANSSPTRVLCGRTTFGTELNSVRNFAKLIRSLYPLQLRQNRSLEEGGGGYSTDPCWSVPLNFPIHGL